MSNRTAEASKAIREAWEREKELVKKGEGTRDWSVEQQKSIIDKGKAYDDDGKAFEGHHMKSAEKYPEYQGDFKNIQFLTRSEHKDAHNGDFHTPTNGYYNPVTGKTTDFGDKKYIPCEIIKLTKPIKNEKTNHNPNSEKTSQNLKVKSLINQSNNIRSDSKTINFHNKLPLSNMQNANTTFQKNGGIFDTVSQFGKEHPFLKSLLQASFKIIAISAITSLNKTGNDNGKSNGKENAITNNTTSKKNYPDERSSPSKHVVSGYDRRNGTHVDSYERGGKNKGE